MDQPSTWQETCPKSVFDCVGLVRVLTFEHLIDFVDHDDIRNMIHLILPLSQIQIQLVIIIVPNDLQKVLVEAVFFGHGSDHEGVDELVNLFDGDVHAVVGTDVALEIKEGAADVIDINKRELLMNIMLVDVQEIVVKAILVKAGTLGSWAHVAGHCVRYNSPRHRTMLPNNFHKCRMLPIGNIIVN